LGDEHAVAAELQRESMAGGDGDLFKGVARSRGAFRAADGFDPLPAAVDRLGMGDGAGPEPPGADQVAGKVVVEGGDETLGAVGETSMGFAHTPERVQFVALAGDKNAGDAVDVLADVALERVVKLGADEAVGGDGFQPAAAGGVG